jgi:hypothetical protein
MRLHDGEQSCIMVEPEEDNVMWNRESSQK